MSDALQEFQLRLEEIANDLKLLEHTFELRPRINKVLNFAADKEVLAIARKFALTVDNRPASFYGPMLIRLVAAFERYLRFLMAEIVRTWAKNSKNYDLLPPGLAEKNLVLTGRLIGNSDSARDHLKFDLAVLVDNLASCKTGSSNYTLNAEVFMASITAVTPEVIETSLQKALIKDWWETVASDSSLKKLLNLTRTVDTKKKAQLKLKELSRWRNNWAHGGDEEISLTIQELRLELDFLSAFSKALDRTVKAQINRPRTT